MKQECLLCERTSPDNNLYCQEIYCPAEMSPTILNYGDWLGNIEIVKPLGTLRSSVLYEARCQGQKVLLKVAHPGPENRERLKREAQFLKQIRQDKARNAYLPSWLPPYTNPQDDDAYGKVVLKGHLLYFCLFEYFGGEPLRAVLAKSFQLWVYHIGWVMVSLASAVAYLQSKGLFHFGLSPDVVLFRTDDAAPAILLFDLGIASERKGLSSNWYPFAVLPAYTAPELIDVETPAADFATDVYGLGLILYELLVGQPAFPFKLHSDPAVYAAVRQNQLVSMNRSEDVKAAADIALRAVNPDLAYRYNNALEMAQQLQQSFGALPERKKPIRLAVTLLVVGALLSVALLLLLVRL